MPAQDALVVGSGVIGLSIARALRHRGLEVTLLDAFPGSGATAVAAGMLAPVTEAAFGEEDLAALAIRAGDAWPAFAAELEAESGIGLDYRRDGTILVASDTGDAAYLEALRAFHVELGLDSQWLSPSEARRLEPLISPSLRGALYAPADGQVDNRRLLAALTTATKNIGVNLVRTKVQRVRSTETEVDGVVTADGEYLAPLVVVAAGYASGLLPGLAETSRPPVRPVKGQILRLRVPRHAPPLTHIVRAIVAGSSVYVVPRSSGQVVVGATVEERGDDRSITAGGVYELLRDAIRVLPALAEYELTETSSGLRPGSFDNAAIIGESGLKGLLLACGHYRNGILFTPLTVAAVMGLLDDGQLPGWAAAFSPQRAFENRPLEPR